MNFEDYRTIKSDLNRQFWEDSSGNPLNRYFILENDDELYGFSMLVEYIQKELIVKETLPEHDIIFYSPELAMDPHIGYCVFVRFKPGPISEAEKQAILYCKNRLELCGDDIFLVYPQKPINELDGFMITQPLILAEISEKGDVVSSRELNGFAGLYKCQWPFEEASGFEAYIED